MTRLTQSPASTPYEDRAAVADLRLDPEEAAADGQDDRPSAWAALDRLRSAAAARDGDLPAALDETLRAFEAPVPGSDQRS